MDAALQRLEAALQQLDGTPQPHNSPVHPPPQQSPRGGQVDLACDKHTTAGSMIRPMGTDSGTEQPHPASAPAATAAPSALPAPGTPPSTQHSPPSTQRGAQGGVASPVPPQPKKSTHPARKAAASQPACARTVLLNDAVRSVRSSAGPLKPILSAVHVPPGTRAHENKAEHKHVPKMGRKHSDEPTSRSQRGETSTPPPPRTPKLSAAQEAAATIRDAAAAKKQSQKHCGPKAAPPVEADQPPVRRPAKRSAQFLAAQAGLQAVIAKQQAASILSPADSNAGDGPNRGARTSNPLAPPSPPIQSADSAPPSSAPPPSVGTRVLPPVPARRHRPRPHSEPVQRAGGQAAQQRSPAETALSAKAASRRAAALNELVSSEVVYISKLQMLVRAFEGELAPGGAAEVAVPTPPACIVGDGPFVLRDPDMEQQAPSAQQQQGSSTPSAAQSRTQPALPEHTRSKSAGSRRFSWLGGTRNPSSFLSAEQHSTLFRAVHTLLPLHFDLLQQLHAAVARAKGQDGTLDTNTSSAAGGALVSADNAGCVEVGGVMYQFSPFFKMYNQYVAGHSAALTLLQELTAAEGAFAEWLRRTEMSPPCSGQTLQSFLIMPVQRVPRYALLLKELLGHTPVSHCDHQPLTQALAVVENSATHINTAISEHAFRQQVVQLQAALSPSPSPSLVGPSTRFVLAGWLNKVTGGTNTREYLVVLLSDCLVYASVSKNTAQLQAHREAYGAAMQAAVDSSDALKRAVQRLELQLERGQLKLHNRLRVLGVEGSLDDRGRHCLQLQSEPKSLQFVCRGDLEATMWQDTLQGVLQEQEALQERRRRGSVAPGAAAGDASPAPAR